MKFKEFNLKEPILRAITETGYLNATPIQSNAIPYIIEGKDLIGCAQTGTGKTAAFAIPILQRLQVTRHQNSIKTLILTPTRELAIQIDENFKSYGKYLPFKQLALFGGVHQNKQVISLNKGIDILIATPGRLLDLIQQKILTIENVEILVLDEADRMLDMGFIKDVKRILKMLPIKKQTLFFSATMPPSIREFANSILNNPIEVNVAPVSSTAQTIRQSVYFVEKKQKPGLLTNLLEENEFKRTLVFTRTKHGADKLVKHLSRTGINAAAIHGNKSQNARQKALLDFKESRISVLVATDIAARGIDIEELPHVVNYELPNIPETYVHRIGRTGRAGAAGIAVSFCDSTEEITDLNNIQKLIGFKVPVANRLAHII